MLSDKNMKILLIVMDGMRPDSLEGISRAERFIGESAGSLAAKTVYPPVTLPAHVSLIYGVKPDLHGVNTNVFTPMPVQLDGLFDVLFYSDKHCAFMNSWDEFRDLYHPGNIKHHYLTQDYEYDKYYLLDRMVKDETIRYLATRNPDFVFTYFGWTDIAGHRKGWMSEEYIEAVRSSWDLAGEIIDTLDDEWTVIVTADHGGHERDHHMDIPEDMNIPLFFRGKDFRPGTEIDDLSILDIAPTVAKLLGAAIPEEWEGTARV